MEKLKTKSDTESGIKGQRAEMVSSSRPSLLRMKGKDRDGGRKKRLHFAVGDLIARGFHYLGTNVTFSSD